MGLSIGRIGALSAPATAGEISSIRSRQYNVKNQSEVSDAYTERINAGAGLSDGITPVDPVKYPNATRETIAQNRIQQLDAGIEAEKAYNKLAERFSGSTSYDAARQGLEYSLAGSHIDAYA